MRICDQGRSFVAPIEKLPTKLLTEIFTHTLSPQFLLQSVLRVYTIYAYWMQLACTTPKLWTSLLPINSKKLVESEGYLTLAKTFLQRSTPLSIPISFRKIQALAPLLVDFLFTLAPRW